MFTIIKRLAFVVLVPAVVGLGAWAQWTTFTTNAAVVGTSPADPSLADVTPDGEQPHANAADPKIKPAPVADRRPREGADEQAQPQAANINAEPAQASAAPPILKVKRLPFALERRSEDGVAAQAQAPAQAAKIDTESAQARAAPPAPEVKPASASDRPSGEKVSGETRKAAEQQQDDRSAREQGREREVRRTQNKDNARKANVAKREKADQAMQNRTGRSALALRDHPPRLLGPDDIDLRRAQGVIAELRKSRSIEDLAARLDALGRGMR
jgi:hypothetical protein